MFMPIEWFWIIIYARSYIWVFCGFSLQSGLATIRGCPKELIALKI